MHKIPFNRPTLVGSEIRNVLDAVRKRQLSGDGHYTKLCATELERYLKAPRVLLTPSCTHALEMAALLLDIKPGDEFIVPSFTFPSTANAFVIRGAIPRFVDIRADTLNLDEKFIERNINSKTKAIVPVHYAGVPAEMGPIMACARRHNVPVVEDAAQALGATYKNKPAGTFGALNAFSFHETKNISCGEGGALVIMDKKFIERAEIIRQKGTNRSAFFRGQVDKYSWVDIGSSHVPSEMQMAFLYAALQKRDDINQSRKKTYERYVESFLPLEEAGYVTLPIIPKHCQSSYHLFHLIFESPEISEKMRLHLKDAGIYAVTHYFPLHLSAMGKKFGYKENQLPVTESIAPRLLRLPLYNYMPLKDQRLVIRAVRAFFGR